VSARAGAIEEHGGICTIRTPILDADRTARPANCSGGFRGLDA
jgi:hypothetical protein